MTDDRTPVTESERGSPKPDAARELSAGAPDEGQPEPRWEEPVVDVDEQKLLAALSYLAVLVLVPLLTRRDDPFVLFHAKQGLVLLVALIVAILATAWVPAVGTVLFAVVALLDLAGLVQAMLGRQWKVPLVYQVSELFRI